MAHVRSAKTLITAASIDDEKVYPHRARNEPKSYIVTRANDHAAGRRLLRAGANKVISPILIGSHRMALNPALADFLELTGPAAPSTPAPVTTERAVQRLVYSLRTTRRWSSPSIRSSYK
ncbi:MAG: hypothetical protein J2P21_21420 [Chloracidobacterium sp.]|nr:hypothetical protein [Chloracidobacterium sp.]